MKPSNASLRQFDLLPDSFHQARRVRALSRSWATVVLILLAGFFLVVVESVLTAQRRAHRNEELACEALPLWDLRETVITRQAENDELKRSCDRLESARPDDSLLQVLAGVAAATETAGDAVIIDSLHLRLAVESSAVAETADTFPTVSISARVTGGDAANQWVQFLGNQARLRDVAHVINADSDVSAFREDSKQLRIEVTGVPVATRMLP